MKVVEIEIFGRGGLTHYVYNLAAALGERGHRVWIATARDYELARHGDALPPGVEIVSVFSRWAFHLKGRVPYGFLRSLKGIEFFRDILTLRRLVRTWAPDVLHVHCTNGIVVWLLAGLRSLGIPIVYTVHDVTPHEPFRFQGFVYGKIYGFSDRLIVHSAEDGRRLQAEFGVDPGIVTHVEHGDYRFFESEAPPEPRGARARLGLPERGPIALFFGFIRRYKGLDLLLDAWEEVRARCPDAHLVAVGDPSRLPATERDALIAQAERLGVTHRFAYVDFEEVPAYFAAADVLVLPYRKISQSGVLLLAMSLGLPVLATRVGAFPEVIEDGVNGRLVPPNSKEALTAALTELLSDGTLRARLADRARTTAAAAHSWVEAAERTEAVFDAAVRDTGAAGPVVSEEAKPRG